MKKKKTILTKIVKIIFVLILIPIIALLVINLEGPFLSLFSWKNNNEDTIIKPFTNNPKNNSKITDNGAYDNTGKFFIYNFQNNASTYRMVDSLFKELKQESRQLNISESEDSLVYYSGSFYWNKNYDISRFISEVETMDTWNYLGLFEILMVKKKDKLYYDCCFYSIHESLENDESYSFSKKIGGLDIQTNCKEFNFTFWKEALKYLPKHFKVPLTKKYRFLNGDKLIAEFDYSNDLGYQINLDPK